jgi:hypothetical protein
LNFKEKKTHLLCKGVKMTKFKGINMKSLVILMLGAFLVSCTGGSNSASPGGSTTVDTQMPTGFVETSMVDLVGASALPDNVPSMITTAAIREASTIITLKNSSSSAAFAIARIQVVAPAMGFAVKVNRCGSSLAPGASCQITVSFSSRALFNDVYTSGLEINDTVLALHGSVTEQPDPDSAVGNSTLDVALDSAFVPLTSTPYRTLTIKNTGSITAKALVLTLPSEYEIRLDRCASVLKPGINCDKQIIYKPYRLGTVPPAHNFVISSNNMPLDIALNPVTNSTLPIFSKSQVSNVELSSDKKKFIITGTDLANAQSAKLLKASDSSLLANLMVNHISATQLELVPDQDATISEAAFTLRIE